MPINDEVKVLNDGLKAQYVAPASVIAGWEPVGDSNYLMELDANPLVWPSNQIFKSSRQIFNRGYRVGRWLWVRMRYDSGGTVTKPPIIKVFGRVKDVYGAVGQWEILTNRAGNISVELSVAATDVVTDDDDKHTTVNPQNHAFDTQGCNEFLIGVEEAATMSLETEQMSLEVRITN